MDDVFKRAFLEAELAETVVSTAQFNKQSIMPECARQDNLFILEGEALLAALEPLAWDFLNSFLLPSDNVFLMPLNCLTSSALKVCRYTVLVGSLPFELRVLLTASGASSTSLSYRAKSGGVCFIKALVDLAAAYEQLI